MRSKIQRRKLKRSVREGSSLLTPNRYRQKRSLAVLFLLLLVWSVCLGWGLALVAGGTVKPDSIAQATPAQSGTIDTVPNRYQLGRELYLENCATCHIALPPEVLPMETWRRLLQEPEQHYGKELERITGPSLLIMWDYLRTFSRPLGAKEPTPYRVSESRFFKALHPRVKFPQSVNPAGCVTCHPGVAQHNYRSLTPEWENSP